MKKNKKNKTTKTLKILKVVAIICVVLLVLEGIYLGYIYIRHEKQTIYIDTVSSINKDKDGMILVGASDFKSTKIGYQDGYQKAKFSKYVDGKQTILKAYTKGYNSIYNDVAVVDDGYIAVGHYEKTKQDNKENTGPAILVKYDKNGNVVYQKEELVLADTEFNTIKTFKNGDYLVAGQTIFENMTLGVDDRGGALMIRYNKDGKEVWRTNYGGSKSGNFLDAYIDEEEKMIYVVGKNSSKLGIFLKYDFDGNLIYDKNYMLTDSIGFSGIDKLNDSYIVVGSKKLSEDRDDYKTEALLLKYSKDGEILFEKTYKKNDMSRFNDIVVKQDKIYVVGHSAILNKEKTTKALRSFDYSAIYATFEDDGKIIYSNEYKEKNMASYFSAILKDKDKILVTGQSNAKLFHSNQKDTRTFLVEINEKGKIKNQYF